MILPLPNPDFLSELLKRINSAKTSIVIVNYLASFAENAVLDPMRKVADALVGASKRGVSVSVFLEGSKFESNYPFYRYLKDGGIDAWLDTSRTFIHQKILMVDESYIIIGSHNLTRASFEVSEEMSVITNEPTVIASFKNRLEVISLQRREIKGNASDEHVLLPASFLKKVTAPLYKARAELAFNLYLNLYLEDEGRGDPVPIDEEKWGRALGFSPKDAGPDTSEKYRRYYFPQRVNKVLRQLKKIGVIDIDRKKDEVKLFPLETISPEVVVKWSKNFSEKGWLKKLSFSAKYFYFISLVETIGSPFYPWWSISVRKICKKYGCDHGILKGALELEAQGILEILRSTPVKRGSKYSEEAQYYRVNPV